MATLSQLETYPAQVRLLISSTCTATLRFHKPTRTSMTSSPARRAQEITRRVNLRDIWQAAYTAGRVLPKPVATCQYWHRSLDPKKVRLRFMPGACVCESFSLPLPQNPHETDGH